MDNDNVVLILPIHLFEDNKLINKKSIVYIYEHPVYFTKYPYHKLKLILHRSTMKYYEVYLKQKYKCVVKYVVFNSILNIFEKHKKINMFDPVDFDVSDSFKKYKSQLIIHETPQFLTTMKDLEEYANQSNSFSQTSFYIWQRKRLDILMDNKQKPEGGKWSYDTDNRSAYPNNSVEPYKISINYSEFVIEAQKYVMKHFKNNIGDTELYLPIDYINVKKHFNKFLKERLINFGKYQDAVNNKIVFGFHSVLSPLINIGLITTKYIVDKTLRFYKKHSSIKVSSVEGFIRQIIGWREYMRYTYIYKHDKLIASNHFNHTKKLKKVWYNAQTNIRPIDDVIKKVVKYAYANHIERLMYLGNFMLLMTIDPKEVYRWFMIMFIDSYNVFMETNVYGMSQYSAGKIMTTRPYFSSSNYIVKLSNYKKNTADMWYRVWAGLYYNFVCNNKKEFSKNYATANAVKQWEAKSQDEKRNLISIAQKYIHKY